MMTASVGGALRLRPLFRIISLSKNLNLRKSYSISAPKDSQTIGSPSAVPAPWLKRMLEQSGEAPRLYAWTPANLSGQALGVDKSLRNWASGHEKDPQRRICILGLGNLGRLFASGLVKPAGKPRIMLVVHRKALLEHWVSSPGIEITRSGKVDRTTDFDVEWWTEDKPTIGPVREISEIDNLIVATKASDALPQVDRLRRYLGQNSTVAFTQNGVNRLWPPSGPIYTQTRFPDRNSPNFVACVTTHGVTSLGSFRSVLASPASVTIGEVLLNPKSGQAAEYLMSQIAAAPDLVCRRVPKSELWVLQLEKLVVNSVINPLTAVLDCKNGEIFIQRDDILPKIIDSLVKETSQVLQALIMHPDSTGILANAGQEPIATRDELHERFSFPKLRSMLYDVGAKVKENTSSMLQDIRAGKATEIQDFNGWLLDTAKFLSSGSGGVNMTNHERLVTLVEKRNRTGPVRRSDLENFFDIP